MLEQDLPQTVTTELQVHFVCLHHTFYLSQAQTIKPSLYQFVDSGVHLFQVRVQHGHFGNELIHFLAESFRKRRHSRVCSLNKEAPLAAG